MPSGVVPQSSPAGQFGSEPKSHGQLILGYWASSESKDSLKADIKDD